MIKLSTNFPLSELVVSQTAAREGWDEQFNPPPDVLENLGRLAQGLEVVRALLNSNPIIISSGYRCPRVNTAAKGARDSAHLLGLAADFTCPKFGTPIEVCRRLAATQHLEFDQVIYEYGAWCHFAVGPGIRRQCLSKFTGDPTYYLGLMEKAHAPVS
jgi:hypothetical protein